MNDLKKDVENNLTYVKQFENNTWSMLSSRVADVQKTSSSSSTALWQ